MFRLLVLTAVTSAIRVECSTFASATLTSAMKAADFEVYGRVQGVFFRKVFTYLMNYISIRYSNVSIIRITIVLNDCNSGFYDIPSLTIHKINK